jgi:hypothetical protein
MSQLYVYVLKLLLSAGLIVVVSEIAKRSPLWGGVLASLPFISILALTILYLDTKSVQAVTELSYSIFWLVLPSLTLFMTLPLLLKRDIPFFWSLLIACSLTSLAYYLTITLIQRLGYKV